MMTCPNLSPPHFNDAIRKTGCKNFKFIVDITSQVMTNVKLAKRWDVLYGKK
jgi:hypothetical protein